MPLRSELLPRVPSVVGAHGAGLANVVFSPPGCTVIEITPEDCEPNRRFFSSISVPAPVIVSPAFPVARDFERKSLRSISSALRKMP